MHSNILDKFKDFKKSIVFEPFVFIEISSQNLKLISKDKVFKSYSISSSKHGIGMQLNSNKTPIGGHIVSEKIGGGEKINTIFKGRVPTHVSESNLYDANADTITSRILWLEGLEEGFNKGGNLDSKNRYIYIHGTTHEDEIGTPTSNGCIRMKNIDVVELFEFVKLNTFVYIE